MRSSKSRSLDGPSKRKIFISIGLALIVLTSFFCGYFTQFAFRGSGEKHVSDVVKIMDQVGYVYDEKNDTYVKIEGEKIAKLISGNFLDGYSYYYTEEEYQKQLAEDKGNYDGFGISVYSAPDILEVAGSNEVYSVVCNSPSYNAGVRAGDVIYKASIKDGQESLINNAKELNEFLATPKLGEEVTLYIERNGEQLEPIVLNKAKYTVCYAQYQDSEEFMYFAPEYGGRMVNVNDALNCKKVIKNPCPEYGDDIAYVKLTSFEGSVAVQFGACLEYMVSRGRSKLILDLCDNGGGNMEVLKAVGSYLIYNYGNGNAILAIAHERLDAVEPEDFLAEGYRTTHFRAYENNFNKGIVQISVLANSGTASAAECLIGAMISYADAEPPETKEKNEEKFSRNNVIVIDDDGDGKYATFGKGVMQTTYELNSGGALKITTAKLIWPDKETCIHKKGISPLDIDGNVIVENQADTHQAGVSRAIDILNAFIPEPNDGLNNK